MGNVVKQTLYRKSRRTYCVQLFLMTVWFMK